MSVSLSTSAFREALAHFASGVTVVTARSAGQGHATLAGFTATSFASVSLSPPVVLVCVGHAASAYEAVLGAERFGINVLAEDQAWVAEQFARKGVDRFSGVGLRDGRGPPLIEGALVQLECRQHARHDVGDHTVLFGEVLSVHVNRETEAGPLVYFGRTFGALGIPRGHRGQGTT